jgi:hypothetical protein
MKFFLPFASSLEEALSVLDNIATFIGVDAPKPEDMIHTVHYSHNGQEMTATVGENINPYYKESNSTVIAIFKPSHEGAPIKICLQDRGVARGEPIFVDGKSQFLTFTR